MRREPVRHVERVRLFPVVALMGGTIYGSPDAAPLDDGVILVRDGLITAVGRHNEVPLPAAVDVLDCSGAVVVAGFWNSHVHFTEPHWAGADTLPAPVLAPHLRAMLTRYGFVRIMDTGSPLANTLALRRADAMSQESGRPGWGDYPGRTLRSRRTTPERRGPCGASTGPAGAPAGEHGPVAGGWRAIRLGAGWFNVAGGQAPPGVSVWIYTKPVR